MECPIGGPRCFEGCAKGNLALNYSPMSYTTERPSVPYRSVGSGGTEAHMRGGGRKPLPEIPVRHAHTALVCQVHDSARGINPLAAGLWVLRLSRMTWICRLGCSAMIRFMKLRNSMRRRRL